MEGKMEELKNLMLGLDSKFTAFEKSQAETNKLCVDNKNAIEVMKESEVKYRKEQKIEISALKKEVKNLRMIARAKNVILYGIPEEEKTRRELYEIVKSKLEEAGINTEYVDVLKRLGRTKGNRPIVITLTAVKHKYDIFNKREELKQLGISAANDVPKEEREDHNKLKEIRDQLKQLDIEAKIYNQKIQVNNKTYDKKAASKFLERQIIRKEREEGRDKDENSESDISETSDRTTSSKKRAASTSPNELLEVRKGKAGKKIKESSSAVTAAHEEAMETTAQKDNE